MAMTEEERKARKREQSRNSYLANLEENRAKRKLWYEKNMKRTHCKRGHELTDDNVYAYISKQGHRVRECKTCAKDKNDRRASQLRENHLERKFGINLADFDKMLAAQDNKCAVCRTETPGGMGQFHVDHCHITGKVRKLLCVQCNSCLGQAGDDPELLEKLAEYVRSHQN